MAWTYKGAADNLSKHATGHMRQETWDKLESLSSCGNPEAEQVARSALNTERQIRLDEYMKESFENW